MNSVLTNDIRAVFLCYTLMKEYVCTKAQEDALIYAINYLSGDNFKNKNEVFDWYEGTTSEPDKSGGIMYPEPNYDIWIEDLKKQNLEWR